MAKGTKVTSNDSDNEDYTSDELVELLLEAHYQMKKKGKS